MKRLLFITLLITIPLHASRADNLDRQWTVFLVQHTHTDIGYTRPQSEILSEHLRYIDYAIDFCEITADYPEESRFKWTCESAWAVSEYLKVRPASQVERLKKCIKNGQMEVTAMYFNMAEITDEESLKYYFHPLRELADAGIPIRLAMQNDVNGAAWCLTDYLKDMGVKYFWIGSNKTRSLLPFDMPTVFRWISPSGKTLVAHRSEHYNTGNFWGIERGDSAAFLQKSTEFLNNMAAKGYPFDAVGIQHEGYMVDNAPPSYSCCEFVRQWNDTHDNPKLRTATASEYMDYICSKYGEASLPEQQVAWPDWWTDGFGSAAKETGEVRKGQADMTGATGLFAMAEMAGEKVRKDVKMEIESAYNNFLFYDEHTFGASESINDPSCWNSQIQFDNKASYAWTGVRKARLLFESAAGLLQEHIRPMEEPSVTLFNPLLWNRDAYSTIFIDYDIVPRDASFRLTGENGEEAWAQKIKNVPEGAYYQVFAKDVPSFGYRTYRIERIKDEAHGKEAGTILENEFYRIEIDCARGGITSIVDKKAGLRELVDKEAEEALGSLIYEKIEDRYVMLDFKTEGNTRSFWDDVHVEGAAEGTLYESLVLRGFSQAADDKGIRCEIRLYKKEPRIEMAYSMVRKDNYDCNGVFVAFPFTRENPDLELDVQGGILKPGENQLEGSSTEWYTMQNLAAAKSDGHRILLSSREVPLVMLGNLLDGPFQYRKEYTRPYVYSWVMNNYWMTNFKASQRDEFNWKYTLTSAADKDDAESLRYMMSDRVELYGRVLPSKKTENRQNLPMQRQFLSLKGSGDIVVTHSAPSAFGDGIILQIRNLGQDNAAFQIEDEKGRKKAFVQVDAIERAIGKRHKSASLEPGGDIFLRIK